MRYLIPVNRGGSQRRSRQFDRPTDEDEGRPGEQHEEVRAPASHRTDSPSISAVASSSRAFVSGKSQSTRTSATIGKMVLKRKTGAHPRSVANCPTMMGETQ